MTFSGSVLFSAAACARLGCMLKSLRFSGSAACARPRLRGVRHARSSRLPCHEPPACLVGPAEFGGLQLRAMARWQALKAHKLCPNEYALRHCCGCPVNANVPWKWKKKKSRVYGPFLRD